jgi:hypothetical protein
VSGIKQGKTIGIPKIMPIKTHTTVAEIVETDSEKGHSHVCKHQKVLP